MDSGDDALDSVERDELEVVMLDRERPNWSRVLFRGCSYGSSLSDSESDEGSSSSTGQRWPMESGPSISRRRSIP